jgi:uncharacterized protein
MDEFFFFKNNTHSLFGCLHQPDHPEGSNKIGLIFCAPFAEEKLWSQRVFVNMARFLSKKGFTVLRFDYMGHGDSDGNFEDSDIESRLKDINAAVEGIMERTDLDKIGLLGLRFGATLAALYAEQNNRIDFLVLLEPVVEVGKYFRMCLRSNLSTQMATYKKIKFTREQMIYDLTSGKNVNIDGYLMSSNFFLQGEKIDLAGMELRFSRPVNIVHISKNTGSKPKKDMAALFHKYNKLNSRSSLVLIKEKPFWNDVKIYYQNVENLFEIILDFMEEDKNINRKPV